MRALGASRTSLVPGGVLAGPWVRDPLWRNARAVPSLDLRFADNKSLVDAVTGASLVTFTRASSGTVTDSAGVIQTAATDVPRFDHNPTTGESLGLLVEEQRSNLLLNSATLSTQSVTVAAAANTLSFYGTGTVTLTGVSTAGPLVGTGANDRVSLTFTPIVGVLVLTVSGSVTNAQLEAGAFPTSYIPTTTAAVTRSADVASITGSAFSSWYNATEGTIYHQGSTASAGNFFSIDDSTVSNRITSYFPAATAPALFIATGGATQANISSSAITAGSTFAQADVYKANDFVIVTNGGTISTDASGSVPTVNRMVIGVNNFGTANINGTIRRLTFWGQRLPNNILQSITQ